MFSSPIKWVTYIICGLLLFIGLTPLEYGSFKFKTALYLILFFVLGVIGVRLLRDKKYRHIKVKLTIAFGIYLVITLIFLVRLGICGDHDFSLYINRNDPSSSIICRKSECYLSSEPCNLYKTRTIAGKLKWITRLADNYVDPNEWKSVNEK